MELFAPNNPFNFYRKNKGSTENKEKKKLKGTSGWMSTKILLFTLFL
jgi:hypothetical protein